MPVNPLRKYGSPDLSNFVIHFTGRGSKANDQVPAEILGMTPEERFSSILTTGQIRGFPIFGQTQAAVCFTEASPEGVRTLVAEGRYEAWGLAFTKDFVFSQKGGPALYVRGDEFPDVHGLPDALRARVARYWPGVTQGPNEPIWQAHELSISEWTHEREWRIPCVGGTEAFTFASADVAFVLVPELAASPGGYSAVAISGITSEIVDPSHVWV